MSKKVRKGIKVVVVNDMEGISGIDDWHQIFSGCREFEEFGRVQVTEDVNAAVRDLRTAGATDIRVVDFHGSGGLSKNVICEKLEKRVKLYQGEDLPRRLKKAVNKVHQCCSFHWISRYGRHPPRILKTYDKHGC